MPDRVLVKHCSPTLAGLKTGNLFSVSGRTKEELCRELRQLNRRIIMKGVRAIPIRQRGDRSLIYVYRPKALERDLKRAEAEKILREKGYRTDSANLCVAELAARMEAEEFPHEIGLFLGYPPQDVKGFIEQGPNGCRLSGCWKVYGDTDAAEKQFEKIRKCRRIYRSMHLGGCPLERLTVRT